MFGLSPLEMLIVGAVAVLLFGSKLPDVARSMGKSLVELKKGFHDVEHEIRGATSYTPPPSQPPRSAPFHEIDDRDESTAPKFEPPPPEEEGEGGSSTAEA